jgi:GTP-binding protein
MFVDERKLRVRSGDGGDGIISWRREKRIARGGPAGGDGGSGGDVVLLADSQLTTFGDMEAIHLARAKGGERGGRNKRHGANADDRIVRIPLGTTIFDLEDGARLTDLAVDGDRWIAARGGRGGYGNAHFASALDQAPRRATVGAQGEDRLLRLELRLLADVGLIGLPNAGKSTLLSRLSSATPRIADYPFTTLAPHLGIVDLPDFTRFILADLPGLIEGAHEGHGLGDRFLRHVERTRVLLHLVDLEPVDGSDPVANYLTIREELRAYGRGLDARPEVLAATKADLRPREDAQPESLSRLAQAADKAVHPISAVTGLGLPALLRAVVQALADAPPAPEVLDHVAGTPPGEGHADRD